MKHWVRLTGMQKPKMAAKYGRKRKYEPRTATPCLQLQLHCSDPATKSRLSAIANEPCDDGVKIKVFWILASTRLSSAVFEAAIACLWWSLAKPYQSDTAWRNRRKYIDCSLCNDDNFNIITNVCNFFATVQMSKNFPRGGVRMSGWWFQKKNTICMICWL